MILDIGPETAERFAEAARRPARWSGTARSACSSSTRSARAPNAGARDRRTAGVLDRRRRRYAGRGRQVRHRRRHLLYLHRRRRVPGVPRRQDIAGGCGPGRAGSNRNESRLLMLVRTKIVATLGPATTTPRCSTRACLRAGADVVRSTSRTAARAATRAPRWCARRRRRAAVRSASRRPAGPEDPHRELRGRQGPAQRGRALRARLRSTPTRATIARVGVAYKELPKRREGGDTLLLDDGLIVLDVDRVNGPRID